MKSLQPITASGLPLPAGHYSHAMRAGDLLFLSGQLGLAAGEDARRSVEDQTRKALGALETILSEIGLDRRSLAKVTIFVTDVADWPRVNTTYAEYFGDHKPARCIVPCAELHHGARVEIEAIAYLGD